MARKLYLIVIEIFVSVSDQPDKKEYIVSNFKEIIEKIPKIPTQFFIENYKENNLGSGDLEFITESLRLLSDPAGTAKIGEVLLKIFMSDSVINFYLANCIYQICKRSSNVDTITNFMLKCIKDLLSAYSQN
jgi:hypothetical protein